jgi:hypothetical protein
LNVSVTGAAKAAVGPTGTVTFADITSGNTSLGTATLGPATAGQSFAAGTTMTFPTLIEDIVTGDFNGDGCQDLAFSLFGTNAILVALGNGDGTFQAPVSSSVYDQPTGMAVGDFNQDGIPDLAVTVNGQLAIMLGNGDGTFVNQFTYAAGVGPDFVSAGDFNEDGILDLAVAGAGGNASNSTINIFLGNGDGSFTPGQVSPGGLPPEYIPIADLNGDGHLDMFATNDLYGYTVLLGKGDGTFTATTFTKPAGSFEDYGPVVLGDFNGDGIPDAVVDDTEENLLVLLGKGDGTFTQQPPIAAPSAALRQMRSADLNGDGKLDLVVAIGSWGKVGEGGPNELGLFYGNGDGTFTQAVIPDEPYSVNVPAVADFNGDGLPDIIVGNAGERIQPIITANIFLDQFSQTSTASLPSICFPGTATHQVQASYSGDGNYQSSSSAPVALTASPVATAVTLTSSPAAVYGSAATLTADVTATSGIPTGPVTFLDGGIPIGTEALDNTGHASLTTSSLSAGSHAITASYGANCPWAASTSAVLAIQVGKAALSVSVGNVSRSYGTANPVFTGSVSGLIGNDSVTVTYSTTATTGSPAGTYPITAAVSGANAGAYAITITGGTLTITKTAGTLALTGGPNPALALSTITFTAQATSSTTGRPTGTVTFSDSGTVLGTATVDSSGQASISSAQLSVGAHSVTAAYGGDQNFLAGNAGPVSETIGDYALTIVGDTNQTVSAGGTATYTFLVTPTTPTTLAPVTLAVAGLPASATGVFSPASVATGSGATSVTLTVSTTEQMGAMRRTGKPPALGLAMAAWLLVLPWGVVRGTRERFRRVPLLGLCVMASGAILCLSQLSGCGGKGPASPAPAAQSYHVTVTASSGSLQHSASVGLTTP